MAHLLPHTFGFNCLPWCFWEQGYRNCTLSGLKLSTYLVFIVSRAYWAADVSLIVCSLKLNQQTASQMYLSVYSDRYTYSGLLVETIVLVSWYHPVCVIHISTFYVTVLCGNTNYCSAYFVCIAAFEAPYHWTFFKGGARTHFVDSLDSHASTKCVGAPPLT